jgi:rfaE bifunctional protein kinase chain/domain/rfaE bifunctional protein nucleotidyltransferase chain/domain
MEQLLAVRAQARAAGRTVVHCHGCFDIVHPGHVHHLEHARSLGDLLIVSVSSDDHVNKGASRPLIPDDLRMRNLAALEVVDYVYLNPHPTSVELLVELKPDVYVKGHEYATSVDPRFLAERDAVTRGGGRVIFSGGDLVYSSTALIGSLAEASLFEDEKLRRFRERYDLTAQRLATLLNRFAGMRVVVAGDYILDRYHFCEALGIAGEAPIMSLRSLKTQHYDGGAGVVAMHAAGLGGAATLVTTCADDDAWHQASNRMTAAGVQVLGLPVRRQTIVKERYLVEDTKTFRVESGTALPLDTQNESLLSATLIEAARGADAVIFTDFGYGTLTAPLLQKALPELRGRVHTISADVSGNQASLSKFAGGAVDLVTPTEREARHAIGDFTVGLGAAVWRLLGQLKTQQAIITLGKQGLVCFDWAERNGGTESGQRLRSEYVPALSNGPAVDPLGCGDSLLAAASMTLAAGGSLQAASLMGSHAAAIQVQRLGNHPIRADDLIDRIDARIETHRRIAG